MARGKTFTVAELEKARAYLDGLPSLKLGQVGLTGNLVNQVYYLLHCETFTLTDIHD